MGVRPVSRIAGACGGLLVAALSTGWAAGAAPAVVRSDRANTVAFPPREARFVVDDYLRRNEAAGKAGEAH